uniref:Foie-gras_1 domain-containing protein n=1 Tax=Macrostomum lignano TaxID=282301 RepID=A0A1I8ISW4_9PLAT
ADAAFLHYAGTMEMAALNQLLATRGTFLSAEALKTKKMYAEAAVQYIKMTTEDSDLRSALLLEQAAHCYLRMRVPHVRKFAFHLILAGHRFSKAAQRAHSLRCYRAALRVYRDRGWTLARTTSTWSSLSIRPPYASWSRLKIQPTGCSATIAGKVRPSSPLSSEILWHVYREFIPTVASPPDYCLIGGALPVLPLPKSRSLKLLLSRPSSQLDDLSIPARGVHFQDADLCHPEWSGLERAPARSGHWPFCAAIVSAKPALSVAEHAERKLPRLNGGGGETPADANAAAAVGLVTNEIEASQMHFA